LTFAGALCKSHKALYGKLVKVVVKCSLRSPRGNMREASLSWRFAVGLALWNTSRALMFLGWDRPENLEVGKSYCVRRCSCEPSRAPGARGDVSAKDRKPALRSAITASVFERSRVDRARRSSGVTITHVAAGELVEQAGELLDPAFSRLGVMLFDDPSAAFAKVRRATKLGDRQRWRCSGELVAKRAAQSGTTCCRRRRR